jgi:hypothetical protein
MPSAPAGAAQKGVLFLERRADELMSTFCMFCLLFLVVPHDYNTHHAYPLHHLILIAVENIIAGKTKCFSHENQQQHAAKTSDP